MEPKPSIGSRFGAFITRARRFVGNLVFVGFLVGLVALLGALIWGGPKVPSGAALVVRPDGELVEQLTSYSPGNPLALASAKDETLLKDLIDAILAAKEDARISALYLDLREMAPSGMTKLQDLRAAIIDFRKSGKRVVAYSDGYTQGPYYVATAADEIWMHPMSEVSLEGFGRWRTYYKDGIDRLGIDWHVFRVGEYKSAVEPYLRNDMSAEARAADSKWLSDLWTSWVRDVAAARTLDPAAVTAYIDEMPARLAAAKGDAAQVAVDAKLVDHLGQRDEIRARMIELVGAEKKEKEKTFKQVSVADYLEAKGGDRTGATGGGDAVAVIVAAGEILDGTQPAGQIGGDSTAALVRLARTNDHVKAIVLRVDSPGGSAFASEVVRRELAVARQSGKKVIVSMGSVAASGGYWISTASDEIWASPETITGSIGIFGMFPTVDKPLAKFLGIRVDGVGTTKFSGALRLDRPLNPEVGRIIQLTIDHGYESFLSRVSEARKLSRDEVDKIARGRVWSGADAKERKLVDRLGTLSDAIASAVAMSGLPKEHRVWYIEPEKKFAGKLLAALKKGGLRLGQRLGLATVEEPERGSRLAPILRAFGSELGEARTLWSFNDPNGVYAYCTCEAK